MKGIPEQITAFQFTCFNLNFSSWRYKYYTQDGKFNVPISWTWCGRWCLQSRLSFTSFLFKLCLMFTLYFNAICSVWFEDLTRLEALTQMDQSTTNHCLWLLLTCIKKSNDFSNYCTIILLYFEISIIYQQSKWYKRNSLGISFFWLDSATQTKECTHAWW